MRVYGSGLAALAILLMAAGILGAEDLNGRYVWPLENHDKITSAFGDYRHRHYHGGIDLSTDGRVGLPVHAADSGWVMRLSTSYWGYGKAVYLHMADGRMAVYGHLSELAPKIQEYLESNQYAARRYQQNLWPSPNEIPIARGEVIGKSGQTGAGPPHLHFEIRTADNRPLNPLRFAFTKTDDVAPTIKSVTLLPRHPDRLDMPPSRVDGGLLAKRYQASGPASARVIDATPSIAGRVGVLVETDDAIDPEKGTVSTYNCRLLVNDILVTEVRLDSIDYDDTRLIDLHHEFDGQGGYAERPVNLFRLPGNRLWHYETALNDGWLELDQTVMAGGNEIRIVVEDAATDAATAAPPETPGTARVVPVQCYRNGIVCRLESGTGSATRCYADFGMTEPLQLVEEPSNGTFLWLPAAAGIGDTIWLSDAGNPRPCPLGFRAITRKDGGEIVSADGRARMRVSPDDLYESAFLRLEKIKVPPTHRPPLSAVYELEPATVPYSHKAELSIQHGTTAYPERLAIYRYDPRGHDWVFEGAKRDPASEFITAECNLAGQFALLADRQPPTIRDVEPGRGERTRDRRPLIQFEMFDDLSGIGSDADVIMTIDGEWTVVEWDPDTHVAKARPREPLTPGEHRVEIAAKDRAGNEETFLRILHIE
jgi:hypothetical protein